MSATARYTSLGFAAAIAVTCWAAMDAHADGNAASEIREYEILVKGKPAGSVSTRVATSGDGLTTVSTNATLASNFIVYEYHYEFHGREQWRGDQLISVDDHAVDGGTQLALRLAIAAGQSVVDVPGKPTTAGPVPAMTTSYWRPPTGPSGSSLVILEADQPVFHQVRIEAITAEQYPVVGRMQHCTHYRLRGDANADLWFDDSGRLVGQQTVEDGYPVELRLTRVSPEYSQPTIR